jgi:hypothetical protein
LYKLPSGRDAPVPIFALNKYWDLKLPSDCDIASNNVFCEQQDGSLGVLYALLECDAGPSILQFDLSTGSSVYGDPKTAQDKLNCSATSVSRCGVCYLSVDIIVAGDTLGVSSLCK